MGRLKTAFSFVKNVDNDSVLLSSSAFALFFLSSASSASPRLLFRKLFETSFCGVKNFAVTFGIEFVDFESDFLSCKGFFASFSNSFDTVRDDLDRETVEFNDNKMLLYSVKTVKLTFSSSSFANCL